MSKTEPDTAVISTCSLHFESDRCANVLVQFIWSCQFYCFIYGTNYLAKSAFSNIEFKYSDYILNKRNKLTNEERFFRKNPRIRFRYEVRIAQPVPIQEKTAFTQETIYTADAKKPRNR